jgi:hypothetical protein
MASAGGNTLCQNSCWIVVGAWVAPGITARRTARSGDSVVSRAHTEIISNAAITRGSEVVGCEQEVTA